MMDHFSYREINVWRRKDSDLLCYRCFRLMPERDANFAGGYCVTGVDRYVEGNLAKQKQWFDLQHLKNLKEQLPLRQAPLKSTSAKAIADSSEWAITKAVVQPDPDSAAGISKPFLLLQLFVLLLAVGEIFRLGRLAWSFFVPR